MSQTTFTKNNAGGYTFESHGHVYMAVRNAHRQWELYRANAGAWALVLDQIESRTECADLASQDSFYRQVRAGNNPNAR